MNDVDGVSRQVARGVDLDDVAPAWRGVLDYVADLRDRACRPAVDPLPEVWEEIGPGYCYGPAFGHWDIVHQMLDALDDDQQHVRRQITNYLSLQLPDGLIPGSLWLDGDGVIRFSTSHGHPPVWPVVVEDYLARHPEPALLAQAATVATRQLAWFVDQRSCPDGGFYYSDITTRSWESGIDEGVRFDDAPNAAVSCIDAVSHVAALARSTVTWCQRLGWDPGPATAIEARLRCLIQGELWDDDRECFFDAWAMTDAARRPLIHEAFWPLAVGFATHHQAMRLIDRHLLDEQAFLTAHPLPSVAANDPAFSLRMWRGPTWNSITYWVARGCLSYARADAAVALLERALDATAVTFASTGCIWEFYHPHGGAPTECQRKPDTPYDQPCRDYLGHNPLRAMARLHRAAQAAQRAT